MVKDAKQIKLVERRGLMSVRDESAERRDRGDISECLVEIRVSQPVLGAKRPFVADELVQGDRQRSLSKTQPFGRARRDAAKRGIGRRKREVETAHLLTNTGS